MRLNLYPRPRPQRGYIMMALVLAVALVLIGLAATLPSISAELRRQREEELIHRGVQYTRATRNYYRTFGRYPGKLEDLEGTNGIRFLRRRYTDPMTGGDFRPLHLGEVQISLSPPGAGPDTSARTADSSAAPSNVTDASSGQSASSPALFVSLSQMGGSGPELGGGPIMGVTSTSQKQSFRVFNKKNHYNEWLFVYSPMLDSGGLFSSPFNGWPWFKPQAPVPPGTGAASQGQWTPGTTPSNPTGQSSGFGSNP